MSPIISPSRFSTATLGLVLILVLADRSTSQPPTADGAAKPKASSDADGHEVKLQLLKDQDIAMVGADNWGIEVDPPPNKQRPIEVHQWFITKNTRTQ